jgi:antirepressor protein
MAELDPLLAILDDGSFGIDDEPSRTQPSTPAPTAAIVRVGFDGDQLECTKDERGVWVSIRRVCDALGLDPHAQRRRLQDRDRCPWATDAVTALVAAAEDGRQREQTFLALDAVPMWLATVDGLRVAEAIRPKLHRYQVGCARVLRDHFFPTLEVPSHTVAMPPSVEVFREVSATLADAVADGLLERREATLRKMQALKTLGIDLFARPSILPERGLPEVPAGTTLLVKEVQSLEGTWSATTVGQPHGFSGLAVNKIARQNAIYGTEPYGTWSDIMRADGSLLKKHWRYNDCGKAALEGLLEVEAKQRVNLPKPKRRAKKAPETPNAAPEVPLSTGPN